MKIIENYLISWHLEELGTKLVSLLLLLLLFTLTKRLCHFAFKHTIKKSLAFSQSTPARQKTLVKLIHSALNYALYFILVYWALTIIGVPVSSLLAGAGIAGVAIGLGAQGFLSDVLNGFFILLENQFDVGESIEIGSITGYVSSVGIRTTQIRGFDGTLHFIPNRNITIVSNKSRGNMRVQIDLPVFAHSDLEMISSIITEINQTHLAKHPEVVGPVNLIGPRTLPTGQFIFRVDLFVENGHQQRIYSVFFKLYQEALVAAGIALPTANTIPTATKN
ncbi:MULTISPECIES: mechanosensitive ion channel family protein [Streptococcus]|uniref:Mechanosensitive ion channel family protein n=1 Tax=Streptococcus caledonicus TaxID=2614158 RepID=A0ABW0UBY2_9STRE|nr:mechanosensitive ion channel family protein [Streptococcus sp. S784/96/1]